MECQGEFIVKGDSEKIFDCFIPEEKTYARSSYTMEKISDGVKFNIIANDAVAFRATTNTITQLLAVFQGTINEEK